LWQKLKGEYIHSFDTLNDFTEDMKPIFKQKREHDLAVEREKVEQLRKEEVAHQERLKQEKRDQASTEHIRKEKEQKEKRYEQEIREREHLAFLRRQELEKQQKNEPKKPNHDNDNDYAPW